MDIQPSVIIWTVICFSILYVILRYVLILPLIRVMDARKARLEAARAASQEAAQALAEARTEAEEKALALQDKKREELEQKLKEAQLSGKKQLEEAKLARMSAVSAYREVMEAEYVSDSKQAKAALETLADSFLRTVYPENSSESEAGIR